MPGAKAHNLTEKSRTDDVLNYDDTTFKDLLLSDSVLEGLEINGFVKPSPIQKKAIPLGRCGFDLIVQAKSGTGKTCVFTVIALEMVKPELNKLQVLILSPTREICVQIKEVISAIGMKLKKLKAEAFIGGIPLEVDKKKIKNCQIAVGAPGRIKHLIMEGIMKVDAVRLFILDEADKLMEENFRKDISFIYLKLPEIKQSIAASATFPPLLEKFVTEYMVNPTKVSPGTDIFLLGIRQFVSIVPSHLNVLNQMNNKVAELFRILSSVPFKQCLVFSNYQSKAETICNKLNKQGWPAVFISGFQNQTLRLKAMSSLKEFRCRVFISTDLTSRGIDAENVNLIINLDLPYDGPTYMHRIGRAGRYGSHGLAITIVQDGLELEQFRKMLSEIGGEKFSVCLFPKNKFDFNIWETKDESFEKISGVEGGYKYMAKSPREKNGICNGGQIREPKPKEEMEFSLKNLLLTYLPFPEDDGIRHYKNLCEIESNFKAGDVSEREEDLKIEDYPSEIRSYFANWEKNILDKYEKKYSKSYGCDGIENEEQLDISRGLSEVCNKNRVNVFQLEENKSLGDGRIDEENDDYEDEHVDYDSSSGRGDGNEDDDLDEDSDYSEDIGEDHLKRYYSMWRSHLFYIRHYVTYLKYCYYWKEILNHR